MQKQDREATNELIAEENVAKRLVRARKLTQGRSKHSKLDMRAFLGLRRFASLHCGLMSSAMGGEFGDRGSSP